MSRVSWFAVGLLVGLLASIPATLTPSASAQEVPVEPEADEPECPPCPPCDPIQETAKVRAIEALKAIEQLEQRLEE